MAARKPSRKADPIPASLIDAHKRRVGIILGNGPSIADYDLTDPFFTQNVTLGSNNIGEVFDPTYYVVCDAVAMKKYRPAITKAHKAGSHLLAHQSLRTKLARTRISYESRNACGPPTKGKLFHGRTTGIVMLHLAWQMGFRYVFLLGIDGYGVSGATHFYPSTKRRPTSDKLVKRCLDLALHSFTLANRHLFDLSSRSVHGVVPPWWGIVD